MYSECYNTHKAISFKCKTDDLRVFECMCFIYNTLGNHKKVISYPQISYFEKWFDEEGCVAKRVMGKFNMDNLNLRQLYDYCSSLKDKSFLSCYSSKNYQPQNALCACEDKFGDAKTVYFIFDRKIVWADAERIVQTSSSYPIRTSIAQITDIDISYTTESINFMNQDKNFNVNISLPQKMNIMPSTVQNINTTHNALLNINETSSQLRNTDIINSISQSWEKHYFSFSRAKLHIRPFLFLPLFIIIIIALIFLIKKLIRKIKNNELKKFRVTRGLQLVDIFEL